MQPKKEPVEQAVCRQRTDEEQKAIEISDWVRKFKSVSLSNRYVVLDDRDALDLD